MRAPRHLADRAEIDAFTSGIFLYADEGTFVSLRIFDQYDRTVPPILIRSVKVNGDASRLVDEAFRAAQHSVDHARSTNFCQLLTTFKTGDGAKGSDLANGLALSVELDEAPNAGRTRLECLLGPATLVVASGSEWINPETGEAQLKLHLHWRLSEPTRQDDEHAHLRAARAAAALLAGADPTGVLVGHPYRWPGSWNTEGRPYMARIIARN
jgi:hypothetical protein